MASQQSARPVCQCVFTVPLLPAIPSSGWSIRIHLESDAPLVEVSLWRQLEEFLSQKALGLLSEVGIVIV